MAPLVWVVVAALAFLVIGNLLEFRAGHVHQGTVSVAPATAPARLGARRRSGERERSNMPLLFTACAALYLIVAGYLVLHRGSITIDAESRVAQAWYVVASRDPHLAAIGFVWNPLPSVAAIPLVMLRGIWPALTQRAFAGCIVSALCMAGAAVQLRMALREMGTAAPIAIVLTACFVLNPMVIYYGANGMSEAMYLLFLIGATRYLLVWTATGRLRALILTGTNLGLAYLTRYEALAAALTVFVVVVIVGTIARDASRPRHVRIRAAGTDVVVVAFPALVAFVGWTIVSWVILGQPFAQFTSQYGNSSQIRASGGIGANGTGWPKIVLAIVQMFSYAPLLVPLLVIVALVAVRRRDRRFLALGALAGPLTFSILAYVDGHTFAWLRFYIPVLPLYLLAAALVLSPRPGMRPAAPEWLTHDRILAVGVALLIGVPGLIGSTLAMGNSGTGPAEVAALAWLFHPAQTSGEQQGEALLPSGQSIARQVDQLGLADGSVALDTFDCGSLIVLNSQHPHQFIITSDRDFQEVVADPVVFHVPYVLVPDGDVGINAIGVAHPGIYDGGTVGNLQTEVVAQYTTAGCPSYRLIRVVGDGA
ncbi:MAG TPA: hypothetical protein VED63_11380 [Acidimicrobiales bacterium]|nr:hypothetical protein [Acidimicrobiales bacterium]